MVLASAERRYPIFTMVRDWAPLVFTLWAFREMDWFTPGRLTLGWERMWTQQDQWLLMQLGLARAVESLGPVLPGYLELCYLFVYAVGPFCVLTLLPGSSAGDYRPLDGRLPYGDAAGIRPVSILSNPAAADAGGSSGIVVTLASALESVAARCGDDS